MSRKVLDKIGMGQTWTSYIGSVDGVLRGAGLWGEGTFMLMGMTGIAFHFIVARTACPSSATVYDWVNEHFAAMDRIGVHSDFYSVTNDSGLNTFSRMQEDAAERIKGSIDRGIGVVAWAPTYVLEFGIIKGYDDGDGVFIVEGCGPENPDPLLYTNLGKSDVPMLSYQIIKGRVDVEKEKIFRDSLQFGVNEWNKEYHISPEYGSGLKGYDNLISTLERGDFNEFGLEYLLAVYMDSKDCIARYINHIMSSSRTLDGLDEPARLFGRVAELYRQLAALVPFSGVNGRGCSVNRKSIPEVLRIVKECRDLESMAMKAIEKALEP